MKKILIVILVLALSVSFIACSADQNTDQEKEPVALVGGQIVTIELNSGDKIVLEMSEDFALNTVANFVTLANEGYYDGLNFHRVIEGFMIQGGCPDGTGRGGPDFSIKGEFSSNGVENPIIHERGVISMARGRDMDSAGSQFFIVHKAKTSLDSEYAAFGKVIEGLDVVDKIANTPTDSLDFPIEPVTIKSITVDGIIPTPDRN